MKTLIIAVSLFATSATAGDVYTGIYAQDGYCAEYICAKRGKLVLYYERDFNLGYDLAITKYDLGNVKAIVRQDENLWTRPGVQFSIGGGSSSTGVLVLAGVGGAPTWVDVFTPSVAIADGLCIAGHLRFKEGGNNDFWAGPSFRRGRIGAFYHQNFRTSGSWEGGVDYQLTSW